MDTTQLGNVGELKVAADLISKGFGISIPYGQEYYDLIVDDRVSLKRVQVKYTESDGESIKVKCRSTCSNIQHNYTEDEVDCIAAYDKTTNKCYYIKSDYFIGGRTSIRIRLIEQKHGPKADRFARDFENWPYSSVDRA